MFQTRGLSAPQPHYGTTVQAQRIAMVLRFASPREKVLDLGSGRGVYIDYLRRKGIPAFGVDRSFYPEWSKIPNRPVVQCDATYLPFEEKAFHTTICFEVLEHCQAPETVLSEIAFCTSKFLILSVPNCDLDNKLRSYDLALAHWTDVTHCNFFTKQSLHALLRHCGYEIMEMQDCYPVTPNSYFWESLRVPKFISRPMKFLCKRLKLVETYWSSTLVAASVPDAAD